MKRKCGTCSEYFRPEDMHHSSGIQAFCSVECLKEKTRTRKIRSGIKSKVKTPVPGSTRRRVFERYRHMCAYCGRSGRGLQIHHIKYRSEGVDHSLNNLVLLCHDHHRMVHSDKRKWQPLLKSLSARLDAGEMPRPSLALMEKDWEKDI